MKSRILLLSGYQAASHQYWCDQLIQQMPVYDWSLVALPDRHFYWRIRSNALTYAFQHQELARTDYDLIVATSMVDICNLKGLLPHLANVPSVYYFHENQFAYPTREQNSNIINAQLTSVYSALSATQLVFNSRFNQDTFFAGVENLIHKMPDGISKDLINYLAPSVVIPVPVQGAVQAMRNVGESHCVEIVWNHRWEYDKQPEVFFAALKKLAADSINFKVHVMGQSFRTVPAGFTEFKQSHASLIETWGYQSEEHYHRILRQAHIVVSTALHDFQGLGMLEAIQAGCIPIAPRRMAYPEYVPDEWLYAVDGSDDEADRLYKKLRELFDHGVSHDIDVSRYHVDAVIPEYQALFKSLL